MNATNESNRPVDTQGSVDQSRRKVVASALALGATGLAPFGTQAFAQGAPVKMGLLVPLSGPAASYGQAAQMGAEIARDQLNRAGGVLGAPMELVIRDSKGNPNDAAAAARELAGMGVKAFVGGVYTSEVLAINPILESLGVVSMTCGSVAMAPTHEGFSSHYFRLNDNSYTRCQAQAKMAAEQYPNATWGAILTDNASSHDSWKAFSSGLKKFGKDKLVEPVLVKFGSSDFRNAITSLMSSPATALYTTLAGADAGTFFQQARPFGLAKKIPTFIDVGSELVAGKTINRNLPAEFWSASSWYYAASLGQPNAKAMYDDYVKRSNGDTLPGSFVGLVHMIINSFAQAMNGSKSTNAKEVIAWLENNPVATIKGPVTFRKEDHQSDITLDLIMMAPREADPGWAVEKSIRIPTRDLREPATPGRAFQF